MKFSFYFMFCTRQGIHFRCWKKNLNFITRRYCSQQLKGNRDQSFKLSSYICLQIFILFAIVVRFINVSFLYSSLYFYTNQFHIETRRIFVLQLPNTICHCLLILLASNFIWLDLFKKFVEKNLVKLNSQILSFHNLLVMTQKSNSTINTLNIQPRVIKQRPYRVVSKLVKTLLVQ